MDWGLKARAHTRCSQIFVVLHHMLLVPSILVPSVVSIFDEENATYTVIAAALATAVSLGLKLELRAHTHARVAKEYVLLQFDAQEGENVQERARLLLRQAPLLPWCICTRENAIARVEGEAA